MNTLYHKGYNEEKYSIGKPLNVYDCLDSYRSHVHQREDDSQRSICDLEDHYNMNPYMSPPSVHWTTVGNVATVRRSSSIQGAHFHSVYRTCRPNRCENDDRIFTKKKGGLFRFLKYRFWRDLHKDDKDYSQAKAVAAVVQLVEISKSSSKRKPTNTTNNYQSQLLTLRAIKKSISLLFSRSNGAPRADQRCTPPVHHQHSCEDNDSPVQNVSRQHNNCKSILGNSGLKLFNEKNKCGGLPIFYESLLGNTKPGKSLDLVTTPGDAIVNNSRSVSTGEQLQSPLDISCYANNNYRTIDNGWKSAIENVCRRLSKDSALADSTLSEDGMPNECKRISAASTISRSPGHVLDSEYFNDSSYSSFNDLRVDCFHNSFSKYQFLNAASQRRSIDLDYEATETLKDPYTKPISDLRHRANHLSVKHRWLSHSMTNCHTSRTRSARAHSWPSCDHSPLVFPLRKFDVISATLHCPVIKTRHVKRDRTSASPLLSQYSKLYSLQSYVVRDICHQYRLSDFTNIARSPIKYNRISGCVMSTPISL